MIFHKSKQRKMSFNENISLLLLNLIIILMTTHWVQSIDPKSQYLKYNETVEYLSQLSLKYNNLMRVSSIGQSVEKRQLLTVKISESHDRQLLKPIFKYVANIHGNEALGKQLLLILTQYLLENYGIDERVTKIINSSDIYLLPSMNPDGFETAKEGDCFGAGRNSGRENANNVDLNRDFPDQFENSDDGSVQKHKKRQPETMAVMTWIVSNPFVLSANLHGGSVVASYPFDDSADHTITSQKSPSPDDSLFQHLALTYSWNHKTMKSGRVCQDDNFENGITNGAFWYDVPGIQLIVSYNTI
jgi:carboxypeptidase D